MSPPEQRERRPGLGTEAASESFRGDVPSLRRRAADRPVPTVRGVLVVDLAPAVDALGFLSGAEAGRRVPVVPEGVLLDLRIGATSGHDGALGNLIAALRPAAGITVSGSNPIGVEAVVSAFRVAYRRVER